MKPQMNNATKEHSIFLSYAHQDEAWVEEFVDALDASGIHNYWFDHKTIAAGDVVVERIENALRESDILVVFFSTNSLENSNVLFEMGAAFANNKTIIPVLIGNVDQSRIPLSLSRRQWIRADSPRESAKQVARIIGEGANL